MGLGANINETWFALATTFFFSPEYAAFKRDDAAFTTDLYETFFNRAPDADGLAYWSGQLANGMPREVLLASFTFSPEFANFTSAIFGNTAARAEVGQFRAAQCTRIPPNVRQQVDAVSSQFLNSPEYLARNRTNAQYVGDLYNAFMRRGGDLTGVLYWIGQLDGGRSRELVRQDFVGSVEFQQRVQRVAATACLQ
jgi:hypothetical protein